MLIFQNFWTFLISTFKGSFICFSPPLFGEVKTAVLKVGKNTPKSNIKEKSRSLWISPLALSFLEGSWYSAYSCFITHRLVLCTSEQPASPFENRKWLLSDKIEFSCCILWHNSVGVPLQSATGWPTLNSHKHLMVE